jgi:hypothetical protein
MAEMTEREEEFSYLNDPEPHTRKEKEVDVKQTQLQQLARPFPSHLVKKPPKGKFGDYVPHSAITERLLSIIGPFDMRVVDIIKGPEGHVEGVILEMQFEIDGRVVTVQEVGDCERPDNWPTQGARLKDAESDAIKRCAMRIGLGLHLWSQGDYFLDRQLAKQEGGGDDETG